MKPKSYTTFASLLIVATLTIGCGTGSDKRQIRSLSIEPAVATPSPGADVQLTAIGIFTKPPSPEPVTSPEWNLQWLETAADGLHEGSKTATVNPSGLAHCNASGATWITGTALTGGLNRYGDLALIRATARINCP
jgi:hypothetical protein